MPERLRILLLLLIPVIGLIFLVQLAAGNGAESGFSIRADKLPWEFFPEAPAKGCDRSVHGLPARHSGMYDQEEGAGTLTGNEIWYRFFFELDARPQNDLILFLGKISPADEVYLGNQLIGATGKFSATGVSLSVDNKDRIYTMPADRLQSGANCVLIRIPLQKMLKRGGFWPSQNIVISGVSDFYRHYFRRMLSSIVLAVIIFMIGIFHLFLSRGQNREHLFFGLHSISVFLYSAFRSPLMQFLFPDEALNDIKKAEYLVLLAAPGLFVLFFQYLIYRGFTRFRNFYSFLFLLQMILGIIILLSPEYATWIFLNRINLLILLIVVALTLFISLRAAREHHPGAGFLLAVMLIMSATVCYDAAAALDALPVINAAPFGLTIFFLAVSLLLGKQFTATGRQLRELQQDLERKVEERTAELNSTLKLLTRKTHQYEKDLRLAKTIQFNMLPKVQESIGNIPASSIYLPIEALGGDYFDYHLLPGGRIAIILVDVAGHGLPAALIAMMVKLAFVGALAQSDSPGTVLSGVNLTMSANLNPGEFFTAVIAVIDPATGDTSYASGGHVPLLLVKAEDHSLHYLKNTGPLLGLDENYRYEEKTLTLKEGDRLLFYTDGFIEAQNSGEESFGFNRFSELARQSMKFELREGTNRILREVFNFTENWAVEDDLTLIMIEYRQPPGTER